MRTGAVALLLLFSTVRAFAQPRPAASLDYPESVQPGDPLSVTLYAPNGSAEVAGELRRKDGSVVVKVQGFPLLIPENRQVSILLFGMPATLRPGGYHLSISAKDRQGRAFAVTGTLTVNPRSFRRENVPLDKSLSDLRRLPDPKKEADARQLWEILSSFDPSGVFEESSFSMPLSEWVQTSGFGDRREYRYSDGGEAGSIHAGLDLAAPAGSPVVAAAAGRVSFAGDWTVTGNSVVLEHLPGVYSLYYHLASVAVGTGDLVKKGDRLGSVGATGLATGPHLHWEVRIGGVAVDPRSLLDTGLVDLGKILHNISRF